MASIAYLGPAGTFTEAALRQMIDAGMVPRHSTGDSQPKPVDTTTAALDAVRARVAEFACVPIENSIDGSVMPTLDSLAIGTPLQVFAEHTLDVAFSIVVKPGRTAADVRTLAAFPVAVAQVRQWLAAHLPAAELRPANANARTRFVLVGQPGPPPARTGADRTSVVLRIDNAPSALVSALAEFGMRGIDLCRIESRPTRTELGTYVFFLDCVGHIDDDAVAEALKALHRRCTDVRYLGSWPTGEVAGAPPPQLDEASRWLAGLRGRSTGDGSAR